MTARERSSGCCRPLPSTTRGGRRCVPSSQPHASASAPRWSCSACWTSCRTTRNGGDVTYLAELVGEPPRDLPLTPAPANVNGEQPLRAAWARPGGVATTIAWADDALAAIGRRRVGPVVQIKTWNLSSILRLPTADGDVWCKSVPPFLAHEGGIIALVGDDDTTLVPPLLASEPATGTVLLGDVPGDDDWDASEGRLLTMVQTLVAAAGSVDRIGSTNFSSPACPTGGPDPSQSSSRPSCHDADVREQLADVELRALDALTGRLPDRFAALDACGIPETLVHGDFHRGNWRFDGHALVLLDWGDTGVGHPLLDMSSFEENVPDDVRLRVRAAWIDAWRGERPRSRPLTWPPS